MEQQNEKTGYETELFEVVGAGQLGINYEPRVKCGGVIGFSLGVSWGRYGMTGGVLSRKEAQRLADHIYKHLKQSPNANL